MPAIRRTPPGAEAQNQAFALHGLFTMVYLLPLVLLPMPWWQWLTLAMAARLAVFDVALSLGEGKPWASVGSTALFDKLLRKAAPAHPERLNAALKVGGLVVYVLAAAGVWWLAV